MLNFVKMATDKQPPSCLELGRVVIGDSLARLLSLLRSDEGWSVFEQHLAIPPNQRPPHISKSSTPQEIETYLRRASFHSVMGEERGIWVCGWGVK